MQAGGFPELTTAQPFMYTRHVGRPRTKSYRIHVKLSTEEYGLLVALARHEGLKQAQVVQMSLKESAKKRKLSPVPPEELPEPHLSPPDSDPNRLPGGASIIHESGTQTATSGETQSEK